MAVVQAYAKINLYLHLTGLHAKPGYYSLESLIIFSSEIYDLIEIKKSDSFSCKFSIDSIPKNNTISKAVELICTHYNKEPNFSIFVNKRIPVSAGLGGGSANAGAILRYFSKIWNIEDKITEKIATQVGGDVLACFKNTTCIMSGIGDKVKEYRDFKRQLNGLYILLININLKISTEKVYKKYTLKHKGHHLNTQGLNIENISRLSNDLYEPCIAIEPKVAQLVNKLKKSQGCKLSRMTGSGSTCFGIFESLQDATTAKKDLRSSYPDSWIKICYKFH